MLNTIYKIRAEREEEERRNGGMPSAHRSSGAPEKVPESAAVAASGGWIEHVTEEKG